MLKKICLSIFLLIIVGGSLYGQTTFFGKNKVQYKLLDWQYIQTRHFDIYFAGHMYETAKFASTVLESSYVVISDELNYTIQKRVPVFIYNSPNDFQQTNIIPDLLPEGVGGFTEAFKNRIAVPFDGSLEDFRHVLHHELTHAVTYDMLYGNLFTSIISRQRLFSLPLWLAEGYAEYSSRHGWDYFADMYIRDATINNYLMPLDRIDGYLAYKEGQALVNYIVDNYGKQKIGEIFAKGKVHLTMNKTLEASLGIDEKELWDGFSKEMKRRYWPEITKRKEPKDIAKALTDHTKDASGFNGKPIYSPKGDRLAIFSDRSKYMSIYLISAINGSEIERLVKAERSGDLESLHSYYSGITFSPDGDSIAFVVKSKGRDDLYFLTINDRNIYKKKMFGYNSILSPVWSPDGNKIAFSALDGRHRDIIIYDLKADSTYNLNNDLYDDVEPSWFPDSKRLAFSSDRPHPDNAYVLENPDRKPSDSAINYAAIYNASQYGNYSLFMINTETGELKPLPCGPGQNREPAVAPGGEKICFVSNRNGIDNLYITYLDGSTTYAVTDMLTGATSPSWSPDGKDIAFSSFNQGGFDVFILNDWQPVGHRGVLAPTAFLKGEYGEERGQYAMQSEPVASGAKSGETALVAHDHAAVPGEKPEVAPDTSTSQPEPVSDTSGIVVAPPVDSVASADSVARSDTTRIEDGEYVHISAKPGGSGDALAGIFAEVPTDSATGKNRLNEQQAAVFDSIAGINRLPSGEYKVHDYRVKFTPDFISGGFSYDTFFGLSGQSVFVFSDYLGDHQIYLLTDLVNTIDQTNIQLYYFYNRLRTNFGVGIFHTKNYYIDPNDFLLSDRFYGFQAYVAYPFSIFSRVEATASQYFIDRRYHDSDDPRTGRSDRVATVSAGLVHDNIIWGITGPLDGRRSRLDLTAATDLGDRNRISFYSGEFDFRKYWHIKGLFSTAVRLTGGASFGKTPRRYFLGGTSNKIGSTTVNAEVYDVENLYFADIVVPLRGYDYYALSGTRYFLGNFEFRYPFIDYLKMNFPLPITIGYLTGNIFYDIGSAWDEQSGFKGATAVGKNRLLDIKSAFGFGVRANLGIFVLRYDLAWRTDLAQVADKPMSYFSIGADF
jgi:Tol biopolymer transport system component